jgi:hypothetical protein
MSALEDRFINEVEETQSEQKSENRKLSVVMFFRKYTEVYLRKSLKSSRCLSSFR